MEALDVFYQITKDLLPICGIVLLVLLSIVVYKAISIIDGVNEVVDKGKDTVDKVNHSLQEIQKPIDTAVKISGGIDLAYGYGEKAIRRVIKQILVLLNYCKDWFTKNSSDNKEEKEENDGQGL